MSTSDLWKRKLVALLHDPPCKALDIRSHEETAEAFRHAAFPGDLDWADATAKAIKDSDWTSSAADRFTFAKEKCSASFTGAEGGQTFKHPLSGHEIPLALKGKGYGHYVEVLQNAFGGIKAGENVTEPEKWRQIFFLYWRRWMEEAVKSDGGRELAYFPADTRIPDHTIWTHMAMTSAFEACRDRNGAIKPAFLFFQLGPVQEFIAQSRSTRDLWSGSYLLAWLTARAIKAVTDQIGPDCIIFPALRGQGAFDILHKQEIYDAVTYKAGSDGCEDTLWNRMYASGNSEQDKVRAKKLLNPTLPNRFLALVPQAQAEELAKAAEAAVRKELNDIGSACWNLIDTWANCAGHTQKERSDWAQRWKRQVELFPQVSWQTMPWLEDVQAALDELRDLPTGSADSSAHAILSTYHDLATKWMEFSDRDPRYFSNDTKTRLNNQAFAWAAHFHAADFAMSARRHTRDFEQFVTDDHQDGASKDSLTGKDEVIGSESFWDGLRKTQSDIFKENEGPYGAISLIKRLWCRKETGCLFKRLGIDESLFRSVVSYDAVDDIAAKNSDNSPYVAVIALDGDTMGQWIGGSKTPPFLQQIGPKARDYFCELFKKHGISMGLRRPLTPSYHLQFSEALANFANHLAGRVVEEYAGQLIYAGGDDVLAMVPGDKAFACARALRAAFRGIASDMPDAMRDHHFDLQEGFARISEDYPLIVPGPATDVSCGIAISHFQYPLQAMVREAQAAEKRAKNHYGRGAMAVSLIKRGGERINWGAKWAETQSGSTSPAWQVYDLYCSLAAADVLSSRFPYALAQLLQPYALNRPDTIGSTFDAAAIILTEFEHVCTQQCQKKHDDLPRFKEFVAAYLADLQKGYTESGNPAWEDFTNLFLTCAFIKRER